MKKFFFAFSILVFITACNSSKKAITEVTPPPPPPPKGVQFMKSEKLMPVLEAAKAENKLVFVDFYTTWCLPCKLMDEDVFTDQEFGKFMNDNFINYKIDAEKGGGPDLSVLFQVIVFPTLLFLDADGKVLVRKNGAAYQTELRSLAAQAKAESEKSGE